MEPPSPHPGGTWVGAGSTSIIPPADYWAYLEMMFPAQRHIIQALKGQSDNRLSEFIPEDLPPVTSAAAAILERVAADGWLRRETRSRCPNCDENLDEAETAQPACPFCGEAFSQHGGVVAAVVYVRSLAPGRTVDWVVAIHGMNTSGAWQEAFSWHLSTTWGRSVPVAVYKYGIIITGVLIAWRRRKLRNALRAKLAALRNEALAQGFSAKPDVIAHSFGTWLFGHLLLQELKQRPEDRLVFGRIILTGCILRPDFPWQKLQEAGLVEDVLNHYGDRDPVVPMAHFTIADSGPSGRRGFDGDAVINLRAAGYGHSDLFSIEKCIVHGKSHQNCTGATEGIRHLDHAYKRFWRPFLTLPAQELHTLPERADPATAWHPLPWLLRGTLFPFLALPLLLMLTALLTTLLGGWLQKFQSLLATFLEIGLTGLGLLTASIAATMLWRRFTR